MAISPFGIQLKNEPGVVEILYKGTREAAWRAAGLTSPDTPQDTSGNGWHLTGDFTAPVTNGPLGTAGWDDRSPANLLFARRFHLGFSNIIQSDVIDASITAVCREAHTVQVMCKYEWDDFSTQRAVHATALNDPGSGVSIDFINRISINPNAVGSGGRYVHFTENNDTNQNFFSADDAVQAGKWQVVTVVHTVNDATTFNTKIFVHTLDNGVVTGGLSNTGTSLRCDPLSGVGSSRIAYGKHTLSQVTSNAWIGDVALGRLVSVALSDTDVGDQAEELLTTGVLADWGNDEVYRHQFKEPPEHVDEGPLGAHIYGEGDLFTELDGLGTGGSLYLPGGSPRYITRHFTAPVTIQNILGAPSAVRIMDLFNDTVNPIPEWTIQVWGSRLNQSAGLGIVEFNDQSGESLGSNFFQVTLSSEIGLFAERGSGINVNNKTSTGTISTAGEDQTEVRLYTIRHAEDPGAAGDPLYRASVDASIDETTRGQDSQFQGGTSHTGWRANWGTNSLIQEYYYISRELTDLEIQQDAARINPGGGSGTGSNYRMRAFDTTLSRYVYWNADEVDSAGAQYAGPGPLTDVVVSEVIGGSV